ncbi:SprB repeat-containing protein [Spirosoma radiotolerans]|uniref:PKD domain-containing protein n=1 Tax=Spirosoma radiotolerans TaxID=1379870 RepID=A0A0E3ZTA8_9BACT|nr:SprB repeat-containing protein [Spirosoma radiotolerans]AKD53813.1 hypothetical protein SD10_01745 [Spirosoma radiotolerans]
MMGNSIKKHRWSVLATFVFTVISQLVQAQSGSFGSTFAHTTAEMAIYEQHDFVTGSGTINAGIIGSERQPAIGMYSFVNPNSSWINASNTAFVDGYVRTYNAGPFTFPIGDNNKYRPAAVSASSAAAPTTAAYYGVDPGLATTSNLMGGTYGILPGGGPAFPTTAKAANVGTVDNIEYWDIDGTTPAKITLTWDANTPISAMVGANLNNLTIVGWDGTQWVAIPSTVDASSLAQNTSASTFNGLSASVTAGSITTTAAIVPGSFTVYTLAGACPPTTIVPNLTSLTICSGTQVAINYTTNPAGGQTLWTRMPGNVSSFGDVTDFPTATGSNPVSYTYSAVVTSFSCPSQTAVTTVLVNPVPIVTPSVCSQTICSGQTGAITFATDIPATINWLRVEDNATGTGNISQLFNTAGTYTYKIWGVSSSASCPSSTTITCTIVVNQSLIATATVAAGSGCIGQPFNLSATSTGGQAPFTYAWTGPNSYVGSGVNPQVTNSASTAINGNYIVTVTDAQGCSGTATVAVSASNCCSLTATAGNTLVACAGGTLNLSVTAGNSTTAPVTTPLTYKWSGPNGFAATTANPTLTATAAAAGVYSVTVTDGQSCTATASVTVSVSPQPSAGNDVIVSICNNETVDLATYFPAGGSFSAVTGSLSGSIFNGITSGVGSYTVLYGVGGNGCPVDQAAAVVVVRDCTPPSCNYPISTAVVDASCGNSDGTAIVSLGGLPTGATTGFAWSNGKTGPTVAGLAAGVYSITATVSTGNSVCSVVDSIQVNDIGGPVAEISLITSADCRGANGAVAIDITTGTGPFQISWSGAGSGSTSGANLGTTTVQLAPGSYIFKVTGTSGNTACASYLPITIPQDDTDQISVTGTPTNATACGSPTGSILITATPAVGVTGPFSFSLNGVQIGTSSLPTFTVSGLTAGVYTVSVSSAGGCKTPAVPVTILETGAPTVAGWTAVNPACPSDKGQLVFAGGQPTATYLIREVTTGSIVGPTAGISGASSTSLTLPAGTYSIQQTSTASTCTSFTTATISVPQGLKFNVQYTKVACAPGGSANNDGTISIVQQTGGTAPYSTTVLNSQNQVIAATSPDTYTNLKPGTYQINVVDSKGCSGVQNVFVTVPDCNLKCPIIPMNTFVVDANCSTADGRAVAQLGNFADSDVDYLWSNGFSGPTTNGLAAGVYSVTATVLTGTFVGCPYIETVNVNQIGGPVVAQGVINPSSCAANTGTASFSVASGTGPFAVTWTGPVSGNRSVNGTAPFQFTQSGLAPGSYVFTFTASGSTCKTVLDVTIPVSSSSNISLAAVPTPTSSCGSQDGSISLTASGSGPAYTYTLNGASYTTVSASTLQIPNLPAGVYTLGVISGANSCSTTTTAIIQQTGAPAVTGWTSQSMACADGTGSLTYAGGTGTGTYTISLGGTVVATVPQNSTGPLVTNLPQGVYTVELQNDTCSSFQNFTITGPTGIDFNVQYIAETCGPGGVGNGDGTLNVIQINGGTPTYTVSIINNQGQTIAGASHSNLAAGNYAVSVTDANGCPGNQTALVTVPPCQLKCPTLPINTAVVDNQCGQSVGQATASLLNVPAGATTTYLWSNGQNGPTATGLTAGVYSVTATLFANNTIYAGCTYVDTVNVNDIGGPIASISATGAASCTASNGSVALNIQGGTGPYNITWSGQTTGSQTASSAGLVTISGLKAGSYAFTVAGSANTCKSVIDVVIPTRTPNGFTLSVIPTMVSSCGASDGKLAITVSGGTGPFIYSVNGFVKGVSSSRTFSVQGLPAGVNTVTVMDVNGCDVTKDNILINPTGQPAIANWTASDALCPQNNGSIQFNGSGNATDEYVVTISGTATEIGRTPGNASASYSVPGGTYLITRTNSTSCVSVTTVVVNQPRGLDFNIQYNEPVCLSPASGSLTVIQPSGGTGAYSYTITGATGIVSTSATATGLLSGSYTVTMGDSRGCTFSDVVILSTGSNLSATAGATPGIACIGSPISLSVTGVGGSGQLTYNWFGPNGFSGTGQLLTATASISGSYTVVVTDASGCSATALTAPVTTSLCTTCQNPVLTLTGPVCDPVTGLSTVSYAVSAGASVSSTSGNVNSTLQIITGIAANTPVVVTASVAGGCSTSRTVVTGAVCTTCATAINLSTGNAVCTGTGSYVASVTATAGASLSVLGGTISGNTVTGTVGSSVTVVASIAGCASQTQVIGSPASCTGTPCNPGGPLVSAVAGCDNNGSTYSVVFTAPTGVSVTASAGTVIGNTVTGLSLGSSVTLTAVNSCSVSQVTSISSPVCAPVCQSPVLTLTGPVCDPVTGLSTVSYAVSAGASVTANVGVVNALLNTISNIPANTPVVVTASVAGGCSTSRTVVTGAVCTTCATAINLSTGNAVCTGTGSYVASVTATAGASLSVLGGTISGNTVTGTVGSSVTVVASIAGCASQTQVIGSPASCTGTPCNPGGPLVSAVAGCDNNGSTYSVVFTAPTGVSVTASAGTVIGNTVTGLSLGSSVTLTAVNSCSVSQVTSISSPVCAPVCQSPVLTVTGPVCDPVTGLSTVSYAVSAGASVSSTSGNVNSTLQIITGIAANTPVVVTASVAGGCSTSRTVVTGAVCTTCATAINLSTGNAICLNGTSYVASVTATAGASLSVLGGTISGNTVTGTVGSSVTVVASIAGCASQTQVIGSPASCTGTPCNPGGPLVSAVAGCDNNGSTYSVVFTAPTGVSVTASAGTLVGNTITGLSLGSSVTLTAVNSCSVSQVTSISSPVCAPVCQSPVLTLTGPVCDPVTGLSTVSYAVSAGASVSSTSGNVNSTLQIITGIAANTPVVVTASVAGGCSTSRTVVTGAVCTTCATAINLSTGNAICLNGTSYVASVTATAGASLSVLGGTISGNTVTGTVGSSVTVVASIAGCASQTQVIGSPASCTGTPCNPGGPLVSAVAGCDNNGSTYSVVFTAPTGVSVTASAGTVIGNTVTGLSLGSSVTLTAVNSCSVSQVTSISSPVCAPVCQSPVLTVTGPVCDPVTGLSTVSYAVSAGASVSSTSGNVNSTLQIITGIAANTPVVVTASVAGGCSTSRTVVTGAVCTTCATAINLSTGNAICLNGTSYVASVTATAGASLSVLGGTISGNTVTGTVGSSVTVVASIAGCASQTQIITSPASCTGTPCNPGGPLVSAVAGCDNNGSTYSVVFTAPTGVSVTASAGTLVGNTITGLSLGSLVTLTAVNSCSLTQVTSISSPVCAPVCQSPVLTLTGPVCDPVTGLSTVSYAVSAGASVSSTSGNVNSTLQIITGIAANTPVVVTASVAGGCSTSRTVVTGAVCTTCATAINLSTGNAICLNGTSYVASVTATAGATITAFGGTVIPFLGIVTGTVGTNVTVVASIAGCASQTQVIGSPTLCNQPCPTSSLMSVSGPLCDGNGLTYSVHVTAPGGVTVTTSSGTVINGVVSGISIDTPLSLTAINNNCSLMQVVTVNPPICPVVCPTPIGLNLVVTAAQCGSATGQITATPTNGSGSYTYKWNTGQSGQTLSGLVAGVYSVTVSDANGCTGVSGSIDLPGSQAPVVSLVRVSPAACGQATGSISVSASGGQLPYQYQWSNGASTSSVSGLSAGQYTVTVSDGSGCASTLSVGVVGSSSLSLVTASSPAACGQASGTASVSVSGGSGSYTYQWSNGASTASLSGLVAGAYSVTVSDGAGCRSTATVNVNSVSGPQLTLTPVDAACHGSASGSVSVGVTGGSGSYTYRWSNGSTSASLSGLVAGTYSVSVTDGSGCVASGQVTVGEPAIILAVYNPVRGVCPSVVGDIVPVSISGGSAPYTYRWNTGATSAGLTGVSSGTYTVTITDARGCVATGSAVLVAPTCPVVCPTPIGLNLVVTAAQCGSATGQITASVTSGVAPYSYVWSNGQSGRSLSGLASGIYSVTVTDGNGCTGVVSNVTLPGSQAPTVSLVSVSPAACGQASGGASVSASGGSGAYTYQWSNGASTSSVSGLSAGSYTVSVFDGSGCQGLLTVVVPGSSSLSLTASATPAACGNASGSASVSASGGTTPYQYKWSSGALTASVSGLASGAYSVTVSDAGGCSATMTVNVNSVSGPSLSVNATPAACNATASGSATAVASGGSGVYTYQWSSGQSTSVVSGLSAGTYTVSVTDGNGCKASQQVVISQPAAILAIYSPARIVCPSTVGSITQVSISGGTAPYSYSWSNGATSAGLNNVGAGSYTVTITDARGCVATGTATLTPANCPPVCPPLGINLVVTAAECGSATGQITASLTSGTAPYTYVWSNGQNGPTITGLSSGVYSVTVTDGNGCTGVSGSINLPGSQAPAVSLVSVSPAACGQATGGASVSASGGLAPYSYSWSNGASTSSVSGLSVGTYTVRVLDGSGCQGLLTVVVPGSSSLSLTASATPAACGSASGSAGVVVSGGTRPYQYKWSNGAITASVSGLVSGAYSVSVTDAGGCSATATVNVNSVSGPSLSVNSAGASCNATASGSATAVVSGGLAPYSYSWSNGASTSSVSGLSAGTYTVRVTDGNGCQASQQVVISQPAAILAIYSPARIVCPSTVGSITQVSISGGTAPYSYSWSNGATSAGLNNVGAGSYTVTITDARGCVATGTAAIQPVTCASCLNAFVYLQGALVDADGIWPVNPPTGANNEPLMRDDLRAKNLIPLTDPYRTAPYLATFYPGGAGSIGALDPFAETIINPAVALAARGDSSVVDWVLLEFRDPASPSVVKYTRSGLVLRNGAIVDMDGRSCLDISHVAGGSYQVAVRHRNHLGVMTQSSVSLNTGSVNVAVDFRKLTPTEIWHDTTNPTVVSLYGDKERRDLSWAAGYYALWGGNANRDDKTIYQGQLNDPQEVFNQITTAPGNIFNTPSYILPGYYSGDVNMDGKTIFQGQENDTHIIYNIMIQHPSNVLNNPSFIIRQQLP